jgi:hypothetical protein
MSAPVPPPGWLAEWCQVHLGSRAQSLLFDAAQMSEVIGVSLDDGREVVVKRRPSGGGRAATCVEVQKQVAAAGLPCAAPLTEGIERDGHTIHAEQWRPGGSLRQDDGPDHAAQAAQVLAAVMRVTAAVGLPPRLLTPNPVWVQWEHTNSGPWPQHEAVDAQQASTGTVLPQWLEQTQRRIHTRLRRTTLPRVIGHADWEAQNLRWEGSTIHTIHDWDSLAALPEAAVVGAAAGAFASTDTPTLAPLASSEIFITAYQDWAGRRFTPEEVEVAWAASIYPAAHNARGEVLFGSPLVAALALTVQAEERLRRAGA